MNNRVVFWLSVVPPLAVTLGLLGYGLWRLPEVVTDPELQTALRSFAILGGFGIFLTTLFAWASIDKNCFLPLRSLARGTHIINHGNPAHKLEIPASHWLGEVPRELQELGESLYQARQDIAAAKTTGAREAEEQKSQLEVVLRELSEGVLVCDADAHILLYNPAALKLLPNAEKIGLGRSLYRLWQRAPLESTLAMLQQRQRSEGRHSYNDAEFVCATIDDQVLLHCRMSLLPAATQLKSAFVITFSDITNRIENVNNGRPALRATLENLRQPLANLRAAAESMYLSESMPDTQRKLFQKIVADESATLSLRLEGLSRDLRTLFATQWPLHDVLSTDLLNSVQHRLQKKNGPQLKIASDGMWLHVDGHSIILLLEHLIAQLQDFATEFETQCLLGDRRVYLDLIWQGKPVPAHQLESWFSQGLQDLIGAATVAEVLRRHNSDLWSQAHRREGYALLRLPLPISRRQWQAQPSEAPERPEFYDFSLVQHAAEFGALAERPLSGLTYVVFDTETTGLQPSKGDEIIQIAGVRIVNRRILTGERFDRLVNPRRNIPTASIKIHGITEEQVQGQPDIQVVLPQFRAFVGDDDTVLVAHNAAFDITCLKVKEESTGIQFDNPVLDTLLLSAYLHDHAENHNLDAIAERLGVQVTDRHNAMGDTLVTAQVFVKLLDLLEAQGIRTLGQALEAEKKMVAVRRQMQNRF